MFTAEPSIYRDVADADGAALVHYKPNRAPPGASATGHWQMTGSNVLVLRVAPSANAYPVFPVKVAAFDMDDTLIKSKSGRVFATVPDDWQFIDASITAKMQKLHSEGYHLLILSNQGGVSHSTDAKAHDLKRKIVDLGTSLGVPLSAACALGDTERSLMRKPGTGMWRMWVGMLAKERERIERAKGTYRADHDSILNIVDVENSFFVGDAAGRKIRTMAGRDADFSCDDRKFAHNAGLKFFTPEMFWQGQADVPFSWEGPGPESQRQMSRAALPSFGLPRSEMVLMSGFPGSGKSTFYNKFLAPHGYVHVNRDTLKTMEACLAAVEEALAAGKSVCVDNTNPGASERAPFIALAKKHNRPARVFVMTTDASQAMRMNRMRATLGIAPAVPGMAYRMMQGKLKEKPDAVAEGLDGVVDIPVIPDFTGLPPVASKLFYELD